LGLGSKYEECSPNANFIPASAKATSDKLSLLKFFALCVDSTITSPPLPNPERLGEDFKSGTAWSRVLWREARNNFRLHVAPRINRTISYAVIWT
jgi:hypothetical protein